MKNLSRKSKTPLVIYLIWGCALILFCSQVFFLPGKVGHWFLGMAGFVALYLSSIGYKILSKRRRYLAPSADEIQKRDPRPTNLYFRNFSTDQNDIFGDTPENNLKKILNRHLGPLVALGKPGEILQPEGAARMYDSGPDWKKAVEVLLTKANLVFVHLGCSEGLEWEILKILEGMPPKRVILFLPKNIKSKERGAIYAEFHRRFSPHFPEGLPPEMAQSTQFMAFDDEWHPLLVAKPGAWWRNTWPFGYRDALTREFLALHEKRGTPIKTRHWPWPLILALNLIFVPILIALALIGIFNIPG